MKEKYAPIRSEEMKMMVEYRKKSKVYKIMNLIFWGCWILGGILPLVLQGVSCYTYGF